MDTRGDAVLSEDALRRIGNIERDQIESRVRHLYDLWTHGEIDEMIALFGPDVTKASVGSWTGAATPARGRKAVADEFRRYGASFENIVSVLHELVIDGDRVVVHRTAVGRRRDNGRRYQCDFIDFVRFRDGQMVEFSCYPDAAWLQVGAEV